MTQVPAPPNDTCAGAEVIPGAASFPWMTTLLTNIAGATTAGDPPVPDCAYGPGLSNSVWYAFTPATSGVYALYVINDPGTVLDTVMAIYTSAGSCSGPFTEYACNDDTGGNHNKSGIATNFTAGTTYYVVVWAFFFDPQDAKTALQLCVTKPVPPPNDTCAGAWVIPGAGPFPYSTSTNDTFAATTTGDPPTPSCLNGQLVRSVWYRFAPTNSGTYTFSTCAGVTQTLVNDTFMAIYSSSSGCAGPLVQAACTNDSCASRAALTLSMNTTTTYFIVVYEYFLADELNTEPIVGETALQLRVDVQPPPVITYWEPRPEGFYLQFNGTARQSYTLIGSSDLNHWEPLGSATWLGGSLFEFTDSNPGLPYRFYRVRSP